ncbi:PREDICTED: RAD51-associated protein 1 [Buceros rhinoceros silvestris]|uniref:RAD51-associated protein 1 n=1 Tax=Buceros rhinoceros silvestris TaxID=175836 RepID=UPI00052829F6|nr:PREDICTED: RAD51-associated protein 1 [Buceros rhinoceros silvestris]
MLSLKGLIVYVFCHRNKKIVDYSQFGDLEDDDEDFACIAGPSRKKSRTQIKDPKERKEREKKPQKELTPSQKQTPNKRISLDDKLYKRDLEVALALSIKEKSANVLEVQNSEEQGKNIESKNVHRRPLFSNCSVDSELLCLNQVMDDDIPRGDCRQRTTASKVPAHQKLLTVDSDDREHATDSEPESVPSEESEEDSDYSEGDDEDFAMEKKKAKGNKKKTNQKMPAGREKKNPKSKINTTVTPVVSPSRILEQKPEPPQKVMSSSSEPVGRPLHTSSPVTDRKPKWIPPAASGSSNNSTKCVSVKSPTQCLRLGLSRLARVKPLHPSATSS